MRSSKTVVLSVHRRHQCTSHRILQKVLTTARAFWRFSMILKFSQKCRIPSVKLHEKHGGDVGDAIRPTVLELRV